jgi:hypothetical protein
METPYDNWTISTGTNGGNLLFTGVYVNPDVPIWQFNNGVNPVDLEVSTIAVNPQGNILLGHTISSGTEFNAPLLFQRPLSDINAPVEYLVMNNSVDVPTKPVDGEYITALKDNGTTYDDIAVAGLQIFGNQTIGSPAVAYIDGIPNGDMRINIANGALAVSSLKVSTLFADTVVSTTSGSANSYTASIYMSTPIIYTNYVEATDIIYGNEVSTNYVVTKELWAGNISTNYLSTNDGYASSFSIRTANMSTANISSLIAGNFGASRIDVTLLSSLTGDITFNLVSTLSLFGNVAINPNINLGLGNVIQGLVGGAASQGLGVVLGASGLATGAVAMITGRTSGGANPSVFQTINGTTQLQFSTLGSATTSIFFDTNSASPGTTPALETSTTITIPAGAYCARSVSDPLYINNSVSSIQSFGQWVPVIQGSPTLPSFTISTLNASTIISKSAEISTIAVSSISGAPRLSSISMTGNLTAVNPNAVLTWGSPGFQSILGQTSTILPNTSARTLTMSSDLFGQQIFGLSGNFNSLTGSNTINGSFITGSNWVSTPAVTTSTLNITGDTQARQIVGLSGVFNTLVGTNGVSGNFITSSNWVSTPILNASTITALRVNTNNVIAPSGAISSFSVSSINGATYPPPGFNLPSTLAVSTIVADGNISANGNISNSGNMSTTNIFATNVSATGTIVGAIVQASGLLTSLNTFNTSNMNLLGDIQTSNASATANFVTTNTSTLTTSSITSRGGSISTMNVSTLNGQPYPPPNFGLQLPSTIFLSSVNVNGNFAGGNPSATFGWPGAPGLPSTIINQNGIQTPLIAGLAGSYNALSLVGSNSILNLGVLGSGGGNVATPNPTSIAQFANLSTNTLNASTIRLSGSFAGSSNLLDTFGWPGAQGATPLPSTIIGYQGITTSRVLALLGDYSTITLQNLNVVGGGSRIVLGNLGQGGNIVTDNPNAVANFARLGASTINVSTLIIKGNFGQPSTLIGGNGITTGSIGANFGFFSTCEVLGSLGVLAPGSRLVLGSMFGFGTGGDVITENPNAVANFVTLGASTMNISTIASARIVGALNVQGFTTMSNVQAFGITANTLTASNTIQGDVVTGRVIQATENLTAPLMTLQNLNVQQVATISTGVVSSFFTNFINNQPYPPQSGITGATPSTMFASTINVNGGLIVTGATTNSINNVNISSMSSVSIKGLLTASTLVTTAGMTNTGGLPIITSNLSAVNIQNVLFINGQVYPPPVGSVSLQSTLFLSSVFVNGGLNMSGAPITLFDTALNRTNGNIFANSGTMQIAIPEVGSPGGSAFTITAGSTLASTLMFVFPTGRSRFTSSMFIRDPVPVGTPSQAYLTTYLPGSEAPAGSLITGNVSSPSIYTSSITLAGSGARIVGDRGLGGGVNILSDDFQIGNSAANKLYLNMEQGVAPAYAGSTFWAFGQVNNPQTAYITAGNYWTYFPGIGNPPSGQVVTSNISTVNLVASTISGQNISGIITGLVTGNVSTPSISASSINNFIALPAISGNLVMTLDTTNGAGGFGSFQIQPQSSLYLKTSLSIGSAGGLSDTLRQYAASSIGFAQVNPHIVLSADSIVSTANIAWGFAKDGSPPTTTSFSYFINNLSTSKTNVKTNLGWIGLPNSELYNVLDQTLTPGYLTIRNTTNSIVYVEGVPQYASATTTPYGI